MAQSIKLGNDTYLDASGVEVNASITDRRTLSDYIGGTTGFVYKSSPNGTSLPFNLPSSSRHMIILISGSAERHNNVILVYVTGGGVILYRPLATQSTETAVSVTTNKITFANTSGGGLYGYCFTFVGGPAT